MLERKGWQFRGREHMRTQGPLSWSRWKGKENKMHASMSCLSADTKEEMFFFLTPFHSPPPTAPEAQAQNNATLLLVVANHKNQLWVLSGTVELLEDSPFVAWTAYCIWHKLVSFFPEDVFWVKKDVFVALTPAFMLRCHLYKCHVLFAHTITIFIFLLFIFSHYLC